ncbi:MAG: DUF5399 family protein [Victivallaceae bacterium]
MVEIFNYGSSVYEKFTLTEQTVNDFRKDLKLETGIIRAVAEHAEILDFTPKPSALISLLGTDQKISWARFETPCNYHCQRTRSPYLVPSLGSPDRQDEDMKKITAFLKILTNNKFNYTSKIKPVFSHENDFDTEDEGEDSKDEDQESESEKVLKEGRVLLRVLDFGVKSTNIMIDYVISRMFQFVQG